MNRAGCGSQTRGPDRASVRPAVHGPNACSSEPEGIGTSLSPTLWAPSPPRFLLLLIVILLLISKNLSRARLRLGLRLGAYQCGSRCPGVIQCQWGARCGGRWRFKGARRVQSLGNSLLRPVTTVTAHQPGRALPIVPLVRQLPRP